MKPTEADMLELNIRPIGGSMVGMDLHSRQSVAAKMEFSSLCSDLTLTPQFRDIFLHFPRWKFYTDPSGHEVMRVYSVAMSSTTGAVGLHVLCIGVDNNLNWSLIPDGDIIALPIMQRWSDDQQKRISACAQPGLFNDPCAWVRVAELARTDKLPLFSREKNIYYNIKE